MKRSDIKDNNFNAGEIFFKLKGQNALNIKELMKKYDPTQQEAIIIHAFHKENFNEQIARNIIESIEDIQNFKTREGFSLTKVIIAKIALLPIGSENKDNILKSMVNKIKDENFLTDLAKFPALKRLENGDKIIQEQIKTNEKSNVLANQSQEIKPLENEDKIFQEQKNSKELANRYQEIVSQISKGEVNKAIDLINNVEHVEGPYPQGESNVPFINPLIFQIKRNEKIDAEAKKTIIKSLINKINNIDFLQKVLTFAQQKGVKEEAFIDIIQTKIDDLNPINEYKQIIPSSSIPVLKEAAFNENIKNEENQIETSSNTTDSKQKFNLIDFGNSNESPLEIESPWLKQLDFLNPGLTTDLNAPTEHNHEIEAAGVESGNSENETGN